MSVLARAKGRIALGRIALWPQRAQDTTRAHPRRVPPIFGKMIVHELVTQKQPCPATRESIT